MHFVCRGVAQSGSASGLGPEGRRFESYLPDQFSISGSINKIKLTATYYVNTYF